MCAGLSGVTGWRCICSAFGHHSLETCCTYVLEGLLFYGVTKYILSNNSSITPDLLARFWWWHWSTDIEIFVSYLSTWIHYKGLFFRGFLNSIQKKLTLLTFCRSYLTRTDEGFIGPQWPQAVTSGFLVQKNIETLFPPQEPSVPFFSSPFWNKYDFHPA